MFNFLRAIEVTGGTLSQLEVIGHARKGY